jgi:hypothetical protein
MTLPKIATPTFELTQPSTGKQIQFRPFLVREEKTLLIAKESGDRQDIFNAMKQVIASCILTEGFVIDEVPLFDMEYMFLKIRSKSVSNIVKFKVDDSTDGKTYDLELDLDEVEVKFPENSDSKIMITDKVGAVMKYLTPQLSSDIDDETTDTEVIFRTLNHCIDYVFDDDNVYPWKDYSEKEREEFVNTLPIEAYNAVQKFLETMPALEHIVTYTNSEGKEKKVVFRSLDDFFTFY